MRPLPLPSLPFIGIIPGWITQQCQLIFLDCFPTGCFPSNHKEGSFEAGPARDLIVIRLWSQLEYAALGPALLTGTYTFTAGCAKPRHTPVQSFLANFGAGWQAAHTRRWIKSLRANYKLLSSWHGYRPAWVRIDFTNIDNYLKRMHPDSSHCKRSH